MRAAFVAMILGSAVAAPAADRAPTRWTDSQGNPLQVDGQPRWRLDRVWPDDPTKVEAYQPMPWQDGMWMPGSHTHGGNPRIEVTVSGIKLSGRSKAGASPGNKVPALMYIAPADGWYGLRGTVATRIWEGKGPIDLQLVKRTADAVKPLHTWPLSGQAEVELRGVAVPLRRGEELGLVAVSRAGASVLTLRGLEVGVDLVDQPLRQSMERLASIPKCQAVWPTDEQLAAANAAVRGDGVVFPADSGVINVRALGARGDGVHDDTAAFELALDRSVRFIYVPDGTYLISDTLRWGGRQTRINLQGQSRERTIIKLIDACPGFLDPQRPKAMVWTGKWPAQRFRNGIRDLTFDSGRGNPGAIGVQYMANNQGAMRRVTIRSGDPQRVGVIGLDLGYSNEQGPCLIEAVRVEGFDVGISAWSIVNSITLWGIELEGQRVVGLRNDDQVMSICGLRSRNAVPAVQNIDAVGLLTLIDSELEGLGAAEQQAAIHNEAGLLVRNLRVRGYATAIDNCAGHGREARGPTVDEFVSHEVQTLFEDSPRRTIGLPVPTFPQVPWGGPNDWVSIQKYPPRAATLTDERGRTHTVQDWGPALQQAIDDGAVNVFFPPGRYHIVSEVRLRNKLRRIHGMDQEISQAPVGGGLLVTDAGESPVVVVEHFDANYARLRIDHAAPGRALLLRSIARHEDTATTLRQGAGDLYLDDIGLGQLVNEGGNIWARQLNMEGQKYYDRKLINQGQVWILGYKTEHDALLIDARPGSVTEVLGAFIYANAASNPEKVMFRVQDAALSCSLGEWVGRHQPFTPLVEVRGDQTRRLKPGGAFPRGEGALIPLLTAYPPATSTPSPR